MSHELGPWMGAWEVIDQATGELAGHNLIEPQLGGRGLVESYSTPQRFAGTPNPDGCVRQRWEQSEAPAESSTTVFDGLYRKPPVA